MKNNKISKRMSLIKSKNTKPELILRKILKKYFGWLFFSYNEKTVLGKPDAYCKSLKLAIFVDGCFWHGCFRHYKFPKTNFNFWFNKLKNNINRDFFIDQKLKNGGIIVWRIWEHDLKKISIWFLLKIFFYILLSFINRMLSKRGQINNVIIEGADQQGKSFLKNELASFGIFKRFFHNGIPKYKYIHNIKYVLQLFFGKSIIDRSFLSEFLYSSLLRKRNYSFFFLKIFKFFMYITHSTLVICCLLDFERLEKNRKEPLSLEELQKLRFKFVQIGLYFKDNLLVYDYREESKFNNKLKEILK